MKKIVSAILSLVFYAASPAQNFTVQQYIDTYKDLAIREMKRSGIPASVTLAQGLLETENGNGDLVRKSNNHFGIKCKSSWSGESVSHDDDASGECFRKYNTAEESYRDHSDYLKATERYSRLFSLDVKDYKGWCYGLKKAGYATNPRYPQILIKNIEQYNLQQYTLQGLNDEPGMETAETISPDPNAGANVLLNNVNDKTLFNGLKAVFAGKGTSLLAIATQYNMPLSRLLEYNDLETDGLLDEDEWIYLEKKLKEGKRPFCIVNQGETLHDIAQANAIQLDQLLEYNNLDENDTLKPGTRIFLQESAVSMNYPETKSIKETDSVSNSSPKIHLVQPKEGLYAISKKYKVSVQEIKEWNNLTSEDLKVGQQLIISK